MRVLWFTNTPANADEYFNTKLKGTGGWLKALNMELENQVELHIAFYSKHHESFKYQNTSYYPILERNRLFNKLLRTFGIIKIKYNEDLKKYLKIINDIKPDVIHIHGTENPFGCIIKNTGVPVVVSIQGNINVYYHKFLSGFEKKYLNIFNIKSVRLKSFLIPQKFSSDYYMFKKMAKRESQNFLETNYIIGRTDWDRRITRILAPQSKYFHNDEILRESFYTSRWKKRMNHDRLIIHTTNGNNFYKGFETLCHALNLLNNIGFRCEWRVAGVNENDPIYYLTRKKLKHNFPKNGLKLLGSLGEHELVNKLLEADLYVMVSHIENSPNNLCEAMLLGMPCISTFAGGTSSLIKDNENGILIQSGDPWSMAGAITELAKDSQKAMDIGNNARKDALIRHDKSIIVNQLLDIYKIIIHNNNIK